MNSQNITNINQLNGTAITAFITTSNFGTNFDSSFGTKSTTNLAEGTNLYYTTARFNTDFGTKSTTNLPEGTNLYYTTARFDTRIATTSIDALSDVVITTPANGQLLTYNGTNWVNSTGSATYLPLTGGTLTGDISMGATMTYYSAQPVMTNNTTPSPYVVSGSTTTSTAYYAFDNNSSFNWIPTGTYNTTTGIYMGAVSRVFSGTTYNGEYITLDLGATYSLYKYYVRCSGGTYTVNGPTTWYVGTSTDNITYTLWDSRTGNNWGGFTQQQTFTPTAPINARYIIFLTYVVGNTDQTSGRIQLQLNNLSFDFISSANKVKNIESVLIGTGTKGIGSTRGLEIYGVDGSITGPHTQVITTADAYPLFQQLNWSHDNITLNFDSYYDGSWKSSASGSNFQISKASNKLSFNYKSGITAGSNITWSEAMSISNAGAITANAGISTTTLTASGLITANAGITANTGAITANAGITTTTLTTSDNIVVGSGKKIFVDRSGIANNKLVLWDNGTGSTTSFYGLGIAGGTLMYNVDGSSSNHVFYHSASTELARINASGLYIPSSGASTSVQIGTRSGFSNEPMILLRSGNNANYRAFFGFSGSQGYAWATTNSNGEPSGGYNYMSASGGSQAWAYSSDRRLKSDIKTMDCGDCCEKLMKINCCSYYWKSDEKKENKTSGFIADEVKKIFPEFVTTTDMKIGDDEKLEGITYTSFIPILVSAFQHMAEKVNNLEKQNNNLMNILQDQATQLAEIRAVVFPNATT